jgi:hypothetical protein
MRMTERRDDLDRVGDSDRRGCSPRLALQQDWPAAPAADSDFQAVAYALNRPDYRSPRHAINLLSKMTYVNVDDLIEFGRFTPGELH